MSGAEAQRSGDNPAERRESRRNVSMPGRLVRAGGVPHVIELTDLNYSGCCVITPVALDVGEMVELLVFGRGSISSEVRWYAAGKAGLLFAALPQETKEQIERRTARVEVPGEVSLRAVGQDVYQVRVRDLSTDGCCVELVELPKVGDYMMIKFEGLEVMDADVCWVAGHMAGLKFDQPIHAAVLDLLVKRLGGA